MKWLADPFHRIRYFTTSIKGAGIFLPSSKAYKRLSPTMFSDSMPPTPTTPSLGAFNLGGRGEPKAYTPPTTSTSSKFSQSVGPSRARSPDFKPKSRPSLPRPESPLRKIQNTISTPQSRQSLAGPKLSKSMIGGPRYAPSPTANKFGASVRGIKDGAGDPGKRQPVASKPGVKKAVTARTPSRSESRSESRLGPEAMFDEEADNTPIGVAKTAHGTAPVQQRSRPNSNQNDEVKQLRIRLEERDKQLEKYASDLEEMQNSISELQTVTPKHSSAATVRSSRGSGIDDLDAPSLRALVREKNERMAALTFEFDSHRADFRDTIDILEHTSDETKRHYEQNIEVLQDQIRDLQDRGDDVESVATQLKQLEELVQELEEGLEDARRGEAEARGEVEFLRGEVERGRSELRREKEKAAAALKGPGASSNGSFSPSVSSKELESKDREITGLKAIIHSMSQDSVPDVGSPKSSRRVSKQRHSGHTQTNGHNDAQLAEERQMREKLERDVKDLEGLVDRKTYREEELEHELERLRKTTAHVSSSSNGNSSQTVIPRSNSNNHRTNPSINSSTDWRNEQASPDAKRHLDSMPESDTHSTTMTDHSTLWCEICETSGHDILTCTNMFGDPKRKPRSDLHEDHTDHADHDILQDQIAGLSASSRPNNERDAINAGPHDITPHSKDYVAPLSPAKSPAATTPKAPPSKMPNPMDTGMVAGKESGVVDGGKWCALCERDGHESVDCPFDDAY